MTDANVKRIVFRADGSKELGLGHVSRCLNLACAIEEKFRESGNLDNLEIEVTFVIRGFREVREYLSGTVYKNSTMWLLSTGDDIPEFRNIVDVLEPSIVITDIDLTGRVNRYLEAIHPATHISLHEFNFSLLQGDRVIAPTIHPLESAPGATLGVTHFTGPDYVLLPTDIAQIQGTFCNLEGPPQSVLVTMGGSDPGNLTEKILKAIRAVNNPKIDWTVVLGPASGFDKWYFTREYPALITYLEGAEIGRDGFIDQLMENDAVITNGGTTVYEALALAKPVLAIPQNDFEKEVIRQLVEKDACMTPDETTSPSILEALNRFLDEKFSCLTLAGNGQSVIDGQGIYRVADMVLGILESCR